MHSFDDVFAFLTKRLGVDRNELTPATSLRHDLGVEGDDFFELEEAFAKEFGVDMSGYRWYFHHREEGLNIGSLICKAPYDRVTEIPVTPQLLLDSANAGKWMVAYPDHKLPSRRYDLLFNQLVHLPWIGLSLWAIVRRIDARLLALALDAALAGATAVTWRRYVLKRAGKGFAVALTAAGGGAVCYLLGTSVWAYRAVEQRSALGVARTDAVWLVLHDWHLLISVLLGVTIAHLRFRSLS